MSFELFKGNAKVDTPTGELSVGGRYDNDSYSSRSFVGTKAGVSANVSLINIEGRLGDNSTVSAKGPSLGAALGFKAGTSNEIAAIVEPSLVKFDGNVGNLYGSVGLNATTGIKLNEQGFKAGFLGFGLTWGVGGKFSLDTPVGSLGATTMTNTHTNAQYAS